MSALKHISVWEFLERENLESTENLNKLHSLLLTDKDVLMNAYGWEYEEWLDETNEGIDDGEDAYFNASNQEEREYDQYIATL